MYIFKFREYLLLVGQVYTAKGDVEWILMTMQNGEYLRRKIMLGREFDKLNHSEISHNKNMWKYVAETPCNYV